MKNKTVLEIVYEKMNEYNSELFKKWLLANYSDLREVEKNGLIEAHSDGIKFMAEDVTIPQPASISWFRQKYNSL